ncbi:histidine kinase [Paenibacillus sp. FSL K6-3182]|uniref:sensor histidine kinase n=1 Tax=Paenibacillus sp. FSL K6-3182 TaxID=2921495 RepID=UPI0030CB7E55
MDTMMKQIDQSVSIISRDSVVNTFSLMDDSDLYEFLITNQEIRERLLINKAASNWSNDFTLYFSNKQIISTMRYAHQYNLKDIEKNLSFSWTPYLWEYGQMKEKRFIKHFVLPDTNGLVIAVSFEESNIVEMLNSFKKANNGDPFLYTNQKKIIPNRTAQGALISSVLRLFDENSTGESGYRQVNIDGKAYLFLYVKLQETDWYLIDYVSLDTIFKPIERSSYLFYASIGFVVITSIFALLMLYRYVQIPIRKLVSAVGKLKSGDFSTRIQTGSNNEFGYLYIRFNEMAVQIQELIEKVYVEQIQTRDANMKQLQSQINPHFLYNSLEYINSAIRMKQLDAAERMTYNLGDYYRYMTRVENQMVTVREEMDLVENYLEIQSMRASRIYYEIEMDEVLQSQVIPRLCIQPIVENALIHGLEGKAGYGTIHIRGIKEENYYRIEVTDNGVGMEEKAIGQLLKQLQTRDLDNISCGLWNVHNRLRYKFGEDSGILLRTNKESGLTVILQWKSAESV